MKKNVILAFGLVLAFSACSDFAAVGDLDEVINDLDSLNQRLTDLETRVDILEDLDISATVLAIETMQGDINTNLDSIDALQDRLMALEDNLSDNTGSGDASTVYWGDVKTDAQYKELEEGDYTKITGAVDVNSMENVTLLQTIDYIGSDLTVSDIVGNAEFSALKNVSGSIIIGFIAFDNSSFLSFPNLEFVNGNLYTSRVAHGLDSLSCPVLTAIMGDVSMTFSNSTSSEKNFSFSALNISQLLMVGGDFKITKTINLETINMPVVYIGGDFNLSGNSKMLISQSNFPDVEHIGGSLIIGANLLDSDGNDNTQFFDIVLFDNLTTLGGSIDISGSQDMYKVSGFSKLQYIPGDLKVALNGIMLGHDKDIKLFNTLTTIDGFLNVKLLDGKIRPEDQGNTQALAGFESLVTIGTHVDLVADQIKGFDKLEKSGVEINVIDFADFKISATTLPTFPAFTEIHTERATMIVKTGNTRVANLFPVFTQGSYKNLSLLIEFTNEKESQTISSCFDGITSLRSLQLKYAAGMTLEDDFMSKLTTIEPMSDTYIGLTDFPSGLTVEVEENTDLSCFADLFKAKVPDMLYADSAWIADNEKYELMKQYFAEGKISQQELGDYIPSRKNKIADSFDFYTEVTTAGQIINTNHAEVKLNESDPTPALIQCFKHFGNLSNEELGYTPGE